MSQLDTLPGRGDASRGNVMTVAGRLLSSANLPVSRWEELAVLTHADLDKQIAAFVESYETNGQDYTVVYFASPHEPPTNYESDFVDTMPMELRRRMDGGVLDRADGTKGNASLPLFAKYQFFTPGTSFMPYSNMRGLTSVEDFVEH